MNMHASRDGSGRSVLVFKGLRSSIREQKIEIWERSLESVSRGGRFQSKYN